MDIKSRIKTIMRKVAFLILLCGMPLCAHAQNSDYIAYINKYKDIAIKQMKKYHIPASITLAQGLLESGAGKSELARKSNNHFGIKCHDNWNGKRTYYDDDAKDECFRVYRSVADSYEDHSIFLATRERYAFLFKLGQKDYEAWARGLKKAGYATNPKYAEQLINIIEQYGLHRYDRKSSNTRYLGPHTPKLANELVYVVARQGDTMQAIAEEFGIPKRRLIAYNDLYRGYVPNKGDIIYLCRKHRKALRPNKQHMVADGESMHMISQKYGIRLDRLYEMNGVTRDTYAPMVGDTIKLR